MQVAYQVQGDANDRIVFSCPALPQGIVNEKLTYLLLNFNDFEQACAYVASCDKMQCFRGSCVDKLQVGCANCQTSLALQASNFCCICRI